TANSRSHRAGITSAQVAAREDLNDVKDAVMIKNFSDTEVGDGLKFLRQFGGCGFASGEWFAQIALTRQPFPLPAVNQLRQLQLTDVDRVLLREPAVITGPKIKLVRRTLGSLTKH